MKCLLNDIVNCTNINDISKSLLRFNNKDLHYAKNLSLCSEDFACKKFGESLSLEKIENILQDVEGLYRNLLVPGEFVMFKFVPLKFEISSIESELSTFVTICNNFLEDRYFDSLSSPNYITMSFTERHYWDDRKENIYTCDLEYNSLDNCLKVEKRYSYFDHKIFGVNCPTVIDISFQANYVKSILFFFNFNK